MNILNDMISKKADIKISRAKLKCKMLKSISNHIKTLWNHMKCAAAMNFGDCV